MRWSRAVLFLLSLILQTSVLPHLTESGLTPDLVLVFVVLIGLHVGPREGLWWGALAGLLSDILAGRFIGFNIVTKLGAAYAAGFVGLKVYRHNPGVPAVLGFLATTVQELLMFVMLRLYGLHIPFAPALTDNILPHSLVNLCLAVILSPLVYRVFSETAPAARG